MILVSTSIFVFASNRGGEGSSTLNKRLQGRSQKLKDLQDGSNEARATISKALDLLDKQLNLLGRPGGAGIPEAKTSWPQVPPAMNEAREANVRLPKITREIVDVAGQGRRDIRKVYPTLSARADRRYAQALDLWLESLIQTQVRYSKVDAELGKGFPQYEALYNRTDKFYEELAVAKYKDPGEASQVYSLATSPLVEPLAVLRENLHRLENMAAASGKKTLEAFNTAAGLRPSA